MSGNKKDICGENKTTTTTIEYTHGFNKSTPFVEYFKIGYSVYKKGKSKYNNTQYIYVDWSGESPDSKRKFNNPDSPIWENLQKNIHEIRVLDYFKSIEDMNNNTNYDYYLETVELVYDFEDIKDDIKTPEDESLIYNDKNDSDYKFNLYDIGVFS